ncbi:MAG: class I SAM-dependent methyltransferase [Micavibrio aeruginosavorus]|uniref:Class I SAM-dependent methyltransferase n=1 Tax=Micavibrio aeruginosavorus TaxID=349221 RepID=A0A2W4ZRY4_9BACT|nr:MAG: class I SAM-dependent methyltransferase [Micavibrio aeruginosavorus]
MFAKIASDQLFKRLDSLESGVLTVTTPDGQTRVFEGKTPGEKAHLELHDWSVVTNMMRKGDIGLAEDYRAGKWQADNLVDLTAIGLKNRNALDSLVAGNGFTRTASMFSYLFKMNTVKGSRKNIHEHYDLGNDFYSLWLDSTMTYSSALYKHDDESMVHAQTNKYDRILDRMEKNSGSVLEVGCGWGGFAQRAHEKGDYAIKGITLSDEQHEYAKNRTSGYADIVLEDYRHQTGVYDRIVSIEMFEAVGERFWQTYFTKLRELMKSDGKAVIQTITINDTDFDRYRTGGDFIRSFIFPGGMLPSPSRFRLEAAKAGLKVNNEFFFGQDYARTLTEWLKTFDEQVDKVRALGFDEGFIRLWRFYLGACAGGFRAGRTNVMQVELSHA